MIKFHHTGNFKSLLAPAIAAATFFPTNAQEVKFHNEAADTTRITTILIEECADKKPGDVARIAHKFIGTPYGAGTLEGDSIEKLTVNLDSMDCTTFVETVLALAYTANERRQSWRDFTYNLRRLRYRNGETDGYPSRLHYVSDWIVDNVARGNVREMTREITNARYAVKSLDFMTRNREKYPALADSSNYARMKNVESGFSNHRFPYLKASGLNDKKLMQVVNDGDIICFTTSIRGLDVTHMGIVTIIDGMPRLIHASSKEQHILIDPLSLGAYIARTRPEGIRIIRLRRD